jgi:stage V sporulation protein B
VASPDEADRTPGEPVALADGPPPSPPDAAEVGALDPAPPPTATTATDPPAPSPGVFLAPTGASASASSRSAETARTAGRGGLAIAVAKVSFILFGFGQQLVLPHLVGDDGYGQLRRVFGIVGIVNNVIVGAAIQGVSRSVSSVPEARTGEAFRRTLGMHAVLAVAVAGLFALASPVIARVMRAEHVATPLQLVALVTLFYGLYAPLVGYLNGRRRFIEQAGLDIGYGALRLVATLGAAVLFVRAGQNGVVGAVSGFTVAAMVIVPVALWRAGTGTAGESGPSVKEYTLFLGPLIVAQFFLNVLIQTDMILLSRFVGEAAMARGAGTQAADVLVGAYGVAQLFALLPYQMLISISFVLFPMLARANAERDAAAVARYTATGVRTALIVAGLMCGTVSALGPLVLRFAFSAETAARGGEALRVLALGMGAFAVLGIVSSALTSLKREGLAAGLNVGAVLLVGVMCTVLVPGADFGPDMLVRSATATAIGMTTAAVVGAVALYRISGAFTGVATMARVGIATAVAVLAGSRLPWLGKPAVLVEAAAIGLLYLAVLVVTRELGRADVATLKATFGRKRG